MSGEKEDISLPGDQTPVTTALVTTMSTTMGPPVTLVPTTTPALLGYCPLNLGVVGSHISGTRQKTGGGYQWSMINSNTQELWSLTLKPTRESWYEYEPLHKMGTRQRRIEEEAGWDEQLTRLEDLGPGKPAPVLGPPEIIPKGLLDAKFDGTRKKLAFFVVQVEKFLQA
ncbi:UNVERIFIED_CONTAM: hypothetical protein K2H54_039248 [Gekko kuhli]